MKNPPWIVLLALGIACVSPSDRERPVQQESGETDDAEEYVVEGELVGESECDDPANCEGSEAAEENPVTDPALPEEGWQPPGPYEEEPCNGIDEDGDGEDYCPVDSDGDGTLAQYDCDDDDPTRYVAAIEVICDGVDQNCDGHDICDLDGDGYFDDVDCDDNDSSVGAYECNDIEPSGPLE